MDLPILPILAFGAFFVIMVLIANHQAKKRREGMQKAASDLGFFYQAELSSGEQGLLLSRMDPFHPFGQGERPKAFNLLTGSQNGLSWQIFDYEYTTRERDSDGHEQTTTHRYGVLVAEGDISYPELRLEAEGLFGAVTAALGFRDLQFEYEAFNKRYKVKSPDAKRTHDLIHPKAMDYLMSIPVRRWQFRGNLTVIVTDNPVNISEIPVLMKEVQGFVALVPAYYRQDNPA